MQLFEDVVNLFFFLNLLSQPSWCTSISQIAQLETKLQMQLSVGGDRGAAAASNF